MSPYHNIRAERAIIASMSKKGIAEKHISRLTPEDFYDPNHSNFFGAVKFTDALAAYIDAQYDLPDRRNDPVVQEHWGGVYEKITTTIEDYIAIRAKKAAAKAANNNN